MATVEIPISRQVRATRTAISPRLAMRIFRNCKGSLRGKRTLARVPPREPPLRECGQAVDPDAPETSLDGAPRLFDLPGVGSRNFSRCRKARSISGEPMKFDGHDHSWKPAHEPELRLRSVRPLILAVALLAFAAVTVGPRAAKSRSQASRPVAAAMLP